MPRNSSDRLPHGWELLEAICDIEQLIHDLENTKKEEFTLNDKDLLCLSLTGLTNEEIAKRMKISISTVKTTLKERIYPYIRALAGGNQKAFISPLLLALICRYPKATLPIRGKWIFIGLVDDTSGKKPAPGTPLVPGQEGNMIITPSLVPEIGQIVLIQGQVKVRPLPPYPPPRFPQWPTNTSTLEKNCYCQVLELYHFAQKERTKEFRTRVWARIDDC